MSKQVTVEQVRQHARRVLERDGWARGYYENSFGQRCLVGALGQASVELNATALIYHTAYSAVATDLNHSGSLTRYNDSPGRTALEVAEALWPKGLVRA